MYDFKTFVLVNGDMEKFGRSLYLLISRTVTKQLVVMLLAGLLFCKK